MDDIKTIMKCDNPLLAEEVKNALEQQGIACMLHDETMDTAVGAYGAQPGIAVKIPAKDQERADAIVASIRESRKQVTPWCPSCGSDDVIAVTPHRLRNGRMPVGILIFVIAAIATAYWISWEWAIIPLGAAGALLIDWLTGTKVDHQCRHCGKEFRRR